ncbi:MAG: hypothetical protein EA409_03110 [Saprospirales bacterium]|nr:MAG: hypothetical protein EA409_03110 [Saprospirales bacterium]
MLSCWFRKTLYRTILRVFFQAYYFFSKKLKGKTPLLISIQSNGRQSLKVVSEIYFSLYLFYSSIAKP